MVGTRAEHCVHWTDSFQDDDFVDKNTKRIDDNHHGMVVIIIIFYASLSLTGTGWLCDICNMLNVSSGGGGNDLLEINLKMN